MLVELGCVLFWLECWVQYVAVLYWIKLIALSKFIIKIGRLIYFSQIIEFIRETTLAVYAFSMVGMWIYTFTLNAGHISIVYITSSLLG